MLASGQASSTCVAQALGLSVRTMQRRLGASGLAFSTLVDAALLVAVEEQTTWDQIGRGQRALNDCGARRVALVLANRPEPLRSGRR
jgi:hypothetical protein